MNGRCETDPLDRAVDVCDSCYGEFCKACLVLPKGRKHPICTHCTLALSGVRGHATVQMRGDRRTARQRRAEIQAAAAAPSDDKVFRFFDADAESAGGNRSDAAHRRGRRSARKDRKAQTGPSSPTPGVAPLPRPDEVAAAVAARVAAPAADGSVPTFQPAGSEVDPTELVTVTPAVARLEELRRQGTPPPAPVPPLPRSTPVPADEEPPATAVSPARRGGPPPKPGPAAAPAPRPERRRPADADRADLPPTAPMVGEVRTIGGRRSSDQPQPAEPLEPVDTATRGAATGGDDSDDDDLVSISEALSGVEQYDAGRPVPLSAGTGGEGAAGDEPRKADTDDRGNWIPPILRGMAPDAREASTNLPQRRRGA